MKKFKKVLIKEKKWENTKDVADFFGLLSEKIADKNITLVQGSNETVIKLPERILFRVNAREKDTRKGLAHTINFRLRWVDGEPDGVLSIKQ
jgi:amphi-Trp domain-containing protein